MRPLSHFNPFADPVALQARIVAATTHFSACFLPSG
jgi:hypothetical protein